jgi:hypothetical protein
MARTLEEILQTYFGCKVPFRKDGEFTTTGIEAYKKLEDLLQDLHALGVIPSASDAVRKLDEITHEGGEMPDDDTPKVLRDAIKYIREKIDDSVLAIVLAQADRCWEMHLVPTESTMDCEPIIEFLAEYGEDHGLEERWWEEYCEIDEIIGRL